MKSLFPVWLLFLVCPAGAAPIAQDAGLLDPDAAFRFSAQQIDPHTIEVRFKIADGYYMYRDKFRFQIAPTESKLGKIKFPPGKVKQDPLFGRVETYRNAVRIRLALESLPVDGKIILTAISQGCADIGVCYTPMTSQIVLGPPGAKADEPGKPMSSLLKH